MNIRNKTDVMAWAFCLTVLALAAGAAWLGWGALKMIVDLLSSIVR